MNSNSKDFVILRLRPCSPAPFLWLVVFWISFSNFLLKFVLVRWCLDVDSMSRVLQFTVIWGADDVSLVPKTCCLACLLRPLWHLGGPSSDPGGLRSTRRLGFLLFLAGFQDHILRFVGYIWNKTCVFFACLQVTFFDDCGVCFWMSAVSESSIWCERCCKKQLFIYVGILLISVPFVHVF